jgi:DNA polymerase-3 subunit beta
MPPGVVERRNTIPVLSNVLLEAEGEARSSSPPPTSSCRSELPVPASVAEAGAVTVRRRCCRHRSRAPDGQQIELTLDDNAPLKLVSGRARYKLQTLPATDFPVMALAADACAFEMPAAACGPCSARSRTRSRPTHRAIISTAPASRPTPARWCWRRLMARRSPTQASRRPRAPPEFGATIIPRKTVGEIADLIGDAEGTLEFAVTAKQVRVTIGDIA